MRNALLTIVLLHWAVLVTPGPNVLLVTQLASSGSRSAALSAALGISAVAMVWSVMALMGTQVIFSAHAGLRAGWQALGGIYLIHVAVRVWQGRSSHAAEPAPSASRLAAFRLGLWTNLINPKSTLFFGSVFASALPSRPGTMLIAVAAVIVFSNALVWHVGLALAFSSRKVQQAYARHEQALNRLAGSLIGLFGLRLLVGAATELTGAARAR